MIYKVLYKPKPGIPSGLQAAGKESPGFNLPPTDFMADYCLWQLVSMVRPQPIVAHSLQSPYRFIPAPEKRPGAGNCG